MAQKGFSSKELFAFEDNEVPPVIRDCFIGLISPFEELFDNGVVPSRPWPHSLSIPDPSREPTYPASTEFKKDWLEWIYLEVKVRLECGVRYYNFRGERLAPEGGKNPEPTILFLRKFRRVETRLFAHEGEEPNNTIRNVGAGQMFEYDNDTKLRGQIERKFSSSPLLWIANPIDALSFSGYMTHGGEDLNYRLNGNSLPYILTPVWSKVQQWQQSAEYLIRASDVIVISNTSKEGGIRAEQELLLSTNAMDRAFVTNPENLDIHGSNIRHVDELSEDMLRQLKGGGDSSYLEKLGGWGHWAGAESMKYAQQYIGAIDDIWGDALDSGKEIAPGYFAALFTALMALLIFRGELKGASTMAQTLAITIARRSKEESIQFAMGPGRFHVQDIRAFEILLHTAKWYSENEELFHTVVGLDALYDIGRTDGQQG